MAYDLNKIFGDSVDFHREIATPELTIAEDPFLHQPDYRQLLIYKKLTPLIRQKTQRKEPVTEGALQLYESSNPSFYYVHEVLGDYFQSAGQAEKAVGHWKKALTKPIPKQGEKERIQEKIKETTP